VISCKQLLSDEGLSAIAECSKLEILNLTWYALPSLKEATLTNFSVVCSLFFFLRIQYVY
jgi:hypothetical protein